MTLIFGLTDHRYGLSFYFVCMLLPVAITTSWFFNEVLVPRYLIPGRYGKFVLYLFYSGVISVWLQLIIVFVAFVVLGNYNISNLNPMIRNVEVLAIVIYLIVFIQAFINMFIRLAATRNEIKKLEKQRDEHDLGQLVLKADRKNRLLNFDDILFVESRADYIEVNLENEVVVSRERISKLEERLPASFIRVHRSFIVNAACVSSFSREEVVVGEKVLPVGRKYKDNLKLMESPSV
ncbi:LytR/AlgR family response regulator transcription factor [Fulvivirga sedimenti]|uniref:LytTR family transcriptional regulator n=1 Tax=Fulvivirga sedimenti TaxID=2879465 RepID=A0A9X1HLZ6_9BACT|nr:LytTR family DNA-binding domain-containing protein [Fulvivirga sedimenti]MCA6074331.1 LytTR family transcriptional regulator [Fulvivirga sedimenti]